MAILMAEAGESKSIGNGELKANVFIDTPSSLPVVTASSVCGGPAANGLTASAL